MPYRRTLLTVAAVALLGACTREASESGGGFAQDADSGAAAPATKIVPSPNTPPDSTTGEVPVGESPSPNSARAGGPSQALPGGKTPTDAASAQRRAQRVRDSVARRRP